MAAWLMALVLQSGDLDVHVERLASADVRAQRDAYTALRARVRKSIPLLRRRAKTVRAPIARKRLRETLTYFLRVEAAALFRKGDLDASMALYAEAAGASDLGGYVRKRVARTREEILPRLRRPTCVMGPDAYSPWAHRLKGRYGPWGITALIEALEDSGFDAVQLLAEMGDEAVPALIKALKSPEIGRRSGAWSVLRRMIKFGKKITRTDSLKKGLKDFVAKESNRTIVKEDAWFAQWVSELKP